MITIGTAHLEMRRALPDETTTTEQGKEMDTAAQAMLAAALSSGYCLRSMDGACSAPSTTMAKDQEWHRAEPFGTKDRD